jgi:hypothetical protein
MTTVQETEYNINSSERDERMKKDTKWYPTT